ncbi:hypothetical protein HPB52_021739 [Rhipicephalus sanguineus]|uniref:Uncharacterized protein n=1 Tax=Rhipicephalus sanguineus TaxID=34632 RepID=A0A9D4Q7Z3_RHISA|nr:hypothetical protein HPB52_021739 [Rhipicephalus sanguineus]
MDFLQDTGAVTNLQESQVTFYTAHALVGSTDDSYVNALRIVDDAVTLPPKSSLLTLVTCNVFDDFDDYENIAEANIPLLLNQKIRIARGLVRLLNKRSHVLLTNFSNEFQHVPQDTAIAFLREIIGISDVGALEATSPDARTFATLGSRIHVNADSPDLQMEWLLNLVTEL